MNRPLKVLLADDDPLLLHGLATILNTQPGIEVVAAVSDGAAAMTAMTSHSIDVALLDVDMPVIDGIHAAAHITQRYPNTTVVMLTAFEHDNFLDRALAAGAHGFLTKDIPADQLANFIHQARSGTTVMGPKPTRILANSYRDQLHRRDEHREFIDAVENLPPHLRAVFDLMAHAMPNKTIAARLHLAENTVRIYVSQILAATNSPSRAHLALTATKSGLAS
ncbi:MAG: response regulator transcription factor [Propionibacteriaceae bacterium]|nr:response regulator transcription factor [Propionibacteriaceae bacterium]